MRCKTTALSLWIAVSLSLFSFTAHAEYWSFIIDKNANALYEETSYPYWAETTYAARWNQNLLTGAQKGPHVYFYSGPAYTSPKKGEKTQENSYIWSFWPVGEPLMAGDAVTAYRWAPNFFAPLSIGEGASGKVEGHFEMTTNAWYPGLLRIWRSTANDEPNISYIAQWFKDPASGKWTHIATMRVPFPATRFSDSGGFIEDFSHGNRNPRRVDFRNFYYLSDGAWNPSLSFEPWTRNQGEKGKSGLIDNDTVGFFETCSGSKYKGNMGPGPQRMKYAIKTLSTPPFDPFKLSKISAISAGGQVALTWTAAPTSAPQFAYEIKVFGNVDTLGGLPLATVREIDPDANACLIDVPQLAAGAQAFVKITFTDAFGQESAPVVLRAPLPVAAQVTQAMAVSGLQRGLTYRYFETAPNAPQRWTQMPDFAKLKTESSGDVNGLDLSVRRRAGDYALDWKGFLNVPKPGLWEFSLRSSDGSQLWIDGKLVVDFDGVHSAGEFFSGVAPLLSGAHHVEIRYFKGAKRDASDKDGIELLWKGPGIARAPIPIDAWLRSGSLDHRVRVSLIAISGDKKPLVEGATVVGANTQLSAKVEDADAAAANGEVLYYVNQTLWARAKGASFSVKSLLGDGAINLRARYVDGSGHTFDSQPIRLNVVNQSLTPWTFSALGARNFPAAAQYDSAKASPKGAANDELLFIGDGFNFVWQKFDGDQTIIAHIGAHPDPSRGSQNDGTYYDGSWSGGVIFRDNTNANASNPLGDHFVALFDTASDEIHMQADTDHNGGGPVIGPDISEGRGSWLKLERKGDTFTASLSKDGKEWTGVGTRTESLPKTLYVGFYTLSRPSQNPNPHWWKFDHFSVAKTQ